MSSLPKVALIAGPTASGKSALALAIAERHDGVVINADASQVYADLRILSARPSVEDEARALHRLFGHIDGADLTYSAARWAAEAHQAIIEAHAAGRLPVLVGGSGLYLRTLIDGISPVPEVDPGIRAEVRAGSVAANRDRLAHVDPAAAARLHPADTTRIARALEVMLSSGRSLHDWQRDTVGGIADTIDLVATILLPPRDWLRARCDARFADMFDNGAVDEVRRLIARSDIPPEASVRRAIGVTEIADRLHDRSTAEESVMRAQAATRQYAKRQYTWFRNQPPSDWARSAEIETNRNAGQIEIRLRK